VDVRGHVLSKSQLLTMVWGFDHQDVNLVEVNVSALRRKLEATGPRIIHTVRCIGYVLRPTAPATSMTAARTIAWPEHQDTVLRTA
jgi:DNA-binding response OmpR family regulator